MALLSKVKRLYDRIVSALVVLACILIVLMAVLIGANVIARYFLPDVSLSWAVEVTPWMLFYVTFLGAGWLLRSEGHVRMELLVERLEPRTANLLAGVTSILAAIFCLILGWYGTLATWQDFQGNIVTMTAIAFPRFAILGALPIGSALLVIEFLRRAYKHLLAWRGLVKATDGPKVQRLDGV